MDIPDSADGLPCAKGGYCSLGKVQPWTGVRWVYPIVPVRLLVCPSDFDSVQAVDIVHG